MALQTKVETSICSAVQGMKATVLQAVYTPITYLAPEGGITAGNFAFRNADNDHLASVSGSASTLLGFVERVIATYNFVLDSEATLVFPEGEALTIAMRGDFYVKAPAAVTAGSAVYCNAETGEVAESGEDTGWIYQNTADADEMVIISNWGAAASSSSGSGTGGDQPNP